MTDEELGKVAWDAFLVYPDREDGNTVWERDHTVRELWTKIARAVRDALEDNGLAGKWVEWGYDSSYRGVVLEHDHADHTVKIAQDGDTVRTYWLAADEVRVADREQH